MRRGTTPTLYIRTGTDLSGYARVVLTIKDEAGKLLSMEKDALTITPDAVSATLSQQQTLALQSGYLTVQLRALDCGGTAIASNPMRVALGNILKEGELFAEP